jgi:hypothetical protein
MSVKSTVARTRLTLGRGLTPVRNSWISARHACVTNPQMRAVNSGNGSRDLLRQFSVAHVDQAVAVDVDDERRTATVRSIERTSNWTRFDDGAAAPAAAAFSSQ